MSRMGVFIDGLKGSIPASFREGIASTVKGYPGILFCSEADDLTSPEGLSVMARRLEEEKIDRVVIVGGSPKLYETSFRKWGHRLPLNPYLVAVANVREQALWTLGDEKRALENIKEIIAKTIQQLSGAKPIDSQSLPLKPEVLVLGGGTVGISVALELARSGLHVTLLEKGNQLGGGALELRRFYHRLEEVQHWVHDKVTEVLQNPNITILTQAELKRLDGHFGRFQAKVRRQDGTEITLSPSVVIVASGITTQRDNKGIWGHPAVISLATMEKLLAEQPGPRLLREGKTVENVAFLLDFANEDIKIDSINAVKQGLLLQDLFQCQVAIFCKDVKVSSDGMERLYRKAREKGVLFFKYEEFPKLSAAGDRIRIDGQDTAVIRKEDRWTVSILSDLVVVSEAFLPDPETEKLAGLLKLHLGSRGFLMEDNPQFVRVRSNRRGIFVAGGCRFPQEFSESLIEARAAAEEAIAVLSKGSYAYDLAVAEVDPKKCAVCYTCPRVCPHSAITVEKYAERNIYTIPGTETGWGAAKVDPVACYGCGICVAECPARAITLHHLTDEQIYAEMGL